jgi:hypothetical protein
MRRRHPRGTAVSKAVQDYLLSGQFPPHTVPGGSDLPFWEVLDLAGPDTTRLHAAWDLVGSELTARAASEHPSRQPWALQVFGAPKPGRLEGL